MKIQITRFKNNFWLTPAMNYWNNAFLPNWVTKIRYGSVTPWVKLLGKLGGLPASSLGKSRLKLFQMRTPSFKLAPGGCTKKASEWPDPPVGPPNNFFNILGVTKIYRCGNEGTPKAN